MHVLLNALCLRTRAQVRRNNGAPLGVRPVTIVKLG